MTSNNTNQICSDPAYINAIDQKQRMSILNIPPPRYNNLANNPYDKNYTQYQLDMRRKTEILKYSSNRMSTQTNSLTKAQKYAQLVNGAYQQRTYSRTYINKIIEDLSNGIPLPICPTVNTPSTSCDIPGPAIELFEDVTVPLYNYVNDINRAAFGIINQETTGDIWNYTRPRNKLITDSVFETITSIYILRSNFVTNTFSISIPLSVQISATTINNIPYTYFSDISFSIINSEINVLYSYSNVTLKEPVVFSLNSIQIPSSPIDLSINMINDTSFTITAYLGVLEIDNILLYTNTGYIYDIQLQVSNLFLTQSNYNQYFDKTTVTIYANPENSNGDILLITSANGSAIIQ